MHIYPWDNVCINCIILSLFCKLSIIKFVPLKAFTELNNTSRWTEKLRGIGKVEKINVQLRFEMSRRVNEAETGKQFQMAGSAEEKALTTLVRTEWLNKAKAHQKWADRAGMHKKRQSL